MGVGCGKGRGVSRLEQNMDAEGAKESETSRFGGNLDASATRFGENVMKSDRIVMKIPAERPCGANIPNKNE